MIIKGDGGGAGQMMGWEDGSLVQLYKRFGFPAFCTRPFSAPCLIGGV